MAWRLYTHLCPLPHVPMSDTFRSIFSSKAPTPPKPSQDDSTATTREVRPDALSGAVIRVLGAGGAGSNALARMITEKVQGVENGTGQRIHVSRQRQHEIFLGKIFWNQPFEPLVGLGR